MICIECIGDEALRALLEAPEEVECRYCGKVRPGVTLGELAVTVDKPIRAYLQRGGSYPMASIESDNSHWVQEGEPLILTLQDELEIPYDAAQELADILIENDPAWPPDGEELFYELDQNYRRVHLPAFDYHDLWEGYSHRIKHERRFFDESARERLSEILGEQGSSKAMELPVLAVGPGSPHEVIYRARRVDTEDQAELVVTSPESELGPPPENLAVAGRMNAAGIAVFYGALSVDTAVAEVRPYVGSLVVVGGFRSKVGLQLLDLSRIGEGFTGSIFSSDYRDRVARRRFLEGFHTLIARPIQPRDEPLEYIPTQAVAEYVTNVLGFNGILYASAQVGAVPEIPDPSDYPRIRDLSPEELAQYNVVIFGPHSTVVGGEISESNLDEPTEENGGLILDPHTISIARVTGVSYSFTKHRPFELRYIGRD